MRRMKTLAHATLCDTVMDKPSCPSMYTGSLTYAVCVSKQTLHAVNRKAKTTPVGVDLTRSLVIYRLAHMHAVKQDRNGHHK